MVPPLSVMLFCSSSRQITGCGVSLSNSVELASFSPSDVSGEFDDGTLHAQADSQERNLPFPGPTDRFDLAFGSPFAKSARNQNSVVARQQPFGAFAFDFFALNSTDSNLRVVVDAGVIDGFVDRLVGVFVLGIFSHDGDADFRFRISQAMQQLSPVVQIKRCVWEDPVS